MLDGAVGNKRCLKSRCEEGTYWSEKDAKCRPCVDGCKACKNSHQCELCEDHDVHCQAGKRWNIYSINVDKCEPCDVLHCE